MADPSHIGSLAGYVGQPELTVHAAASAFARILAEGLWLELPPHGVDVLHLVLRVTRTPTMERAGLAQLPHGQVWVMLGNERVVEQPLRGRVAR